MKKLVYGMVGFLAVVAFLLVGLFIAKGPPPEIIVPAEVIYSIGWFNITNTMISAWFAMALIIIVSVIATRSMKLMPSGVQNFMEAVIGFVVANVEDIAGEKNGRRFFTVVATIFLFIIVSNWMGLLPFFNAIGKTEDVGYHVWHELSAEEPHDLELSEEGVYVEGHEFSGWKMNGSSTLYVKPQGEGAEFEVHGGQTPSQALDSFIVFVAAEFAGLEVTEEELASPSAATVEEAAALLDGDGAPLLLVSDEEHAEEGEESEHHTLHSDALGLEIGGISWEESPQKFGLVIPFFRSVFSDVNNTLAMGIVAAIMIEVWGLQALGPAYLKKFFNLNGIMSFVGILELLSEFIRIISFTFRLFGNIFAGEVLIIMLTFLMPFLLVDIIYGLELFVGFIQAAVFALLVLVFGVMAIESHDEEHEEHHPDAGSPDPHPTTGAAQVH